MLCCYREKNVFFAIIDKGKDGVSIIPNAVIIERSFLYSRVLGEPLMMAPVPPLSLPWP